MIILFAMIAILSAAAAILLIREKLNYPVTGIQHAQYSRYSVTVTHKQTGTKSEGFSNECYKHAESLARASCVAEVARTKKRERYEKRYSARTESSSL